jgi:2-polyprenyl-3-methyl-5-hydroxy-6-metoxy-1,4-benzoquinol methylase
VTPPINPQTLASLKRDVEEEVRTLEIVIRSHLPQSRDAAIVDLGCGAGPALVMLQRNGYHCARGIDIDASKIESAAALGLTNVACASIEETVRDSHDVDCFLMLDVVEHLRREDAIAAVRGMHRALRTGGVVIARTPNIDAPFATVWSFGDLTHELHLNKVSAGGLFRSAPFARVDVLQVPLTTGSSVLKSLRVVAQPVRWIGRRLYAAIQGIRPGDFYDAGNLLIVARK